MEKWGSATPQSKNKKKLSTQEYLDTGKQGPMREKPGLLQFARHLADLGL